MKIVEIKPILVGNIPPYQGGRCWFFVKLITDDGIEGIGEWSVGQIGREESQIRLIEDLGKLFVIGTDPFRIEDLWQRIYTTAHDYRHPGLTSTPALSAIEMACWDIVGKALKQPVYNLLGGMYHEKLRAYSYMRAYSDLPDLASLAPPERAGKIAADMLEHGFTALKFDPFTPLFPGPRDFTLKTINRVADIFKGIRDAVGDEVEIGLGTHGQFNTYSAIRVAKILEKYNPFWFEEPVPPENVDEMARVAAHTSIPIAAGERLVTKYEFAEVLEKQAAQILQLDVGHCGGILESKKIAGMAEAHYAAIAPHMYCGPVAAAAAIQLDTCSPNFLIQEFNTTGLHAEILKKPIRFDKGYIIPPTEPGLGVELNEDVVAEHPYKPN
jgi:2-dehydro-3-deoxyphosphogalactonate aldolase